MWILTRNVLDEGQPEDMECGPAVLPRSDDYIEGAELPIKFRLLDDDREVYYEGQGNDAWLNGPEEIAFAPLDWATGFAGATELQYRDSDEWKTL